MRRFAWWCGAFGFGALGACGEVAPPAAPPALAKVAVAPPQALPTFDIRCVGDMCAEVDLVGGESVAPKDLSFPDDTRPWLASARIALTSDEAWIAVPDAETDRVVFFATDDLSRSVAVVVGRDPEHLLTLPDGTIAAACRADGGIAIVDPREGVVTRWIPTGAEPRGMALGPDGKRLFVAASAADTVEAYRLADGAPLWKTPVDSGPTAVAADSLGEHVYVSHQRKGHLTRLAPATGKITLVPRLLDEPSDQAASGVTASMVNALVPLPGGDVLAPFTLARTGSRDPKVIVETDTYGGGTTVNFEEDTSPLLTSAITRFGPSGTITTGIERDGYRIVGDTPLSSPLELVAAARHPDGEVALVDQSAGQLAFVEPGQMDARPSLYASLMLADAGPGAAVFSRHGDTLFVASWIARTVAKVDSRDMRNDSLRQAAWERASYAKRDIPDEVALGRQLFHTLDARVSTLGVTCASCHPDGREDGRTWIQSFGPRQTPALAGRLDGTGPFNWLGSEVTVEANLTKTIARLAGHGLDEEAAHALVSYLESDLDGFGAPPAGHAELDAQALRGKALFESAEVGCSTCHDSDNGFTDGMEHDIGSTSALEKELFKAQRGRPFPEGFEKVPGKKIAFDTPSLVGIARTAPYFHDGSAATLREVLVDKNVGDKMGTTSHLPPEDIDALVAYLRTL